MPPRFRGDKILIGVIANDAARFSEFGACVTNLQIPADHRIEWVIGGDWCGARNALARLTLAEGYTHLWFMDDDHAFAPDILMKLLRHDVPLVNPICFTRTWPFQPVTYLTDGTLDLASVPDRGLVELHAGGAAGMLIRRDVLEALHDPWFEYSDRSEDVIFCEKAKEAGFTLYGDLEARLGHITTAVVWPSFNPEHGWMTGLTIGKDMQIQIPLTADLLNHDIRRVEVPFESDPRNRDDNPHPDAEPVGAGSPSGGEEGVGSAPESASGPAPNPCLICGAQSVWRDVHGQQGCDLHHPQHEAWQSYWERAEMWFKEDANRWYYRLVRGDGSVGFLHERGMIHERNVLEFLDANQPGLPVFHIRDEMDDSRRERIGPPLRLWDRSPR